MTDRLLPRVTPTDLPAIRRDAVDPATLAQAAAIVADIRRGGLDSLIAHSTRFGDLPPGMPLVHTRAMLEQSLVRVAPRERSLLERTAQRIRMFAEAQRGSITDLTVAIPGGAAGHRIEPLARAGCYAPGGRFPLPSSILMTVVTARAAGVREVWAATPRPTAIMLAAAAVAGADALISAGGAHAIAALAYGAGDIPPCDIVVGPGNRWVTAAKQIVSADVAIDMLAGPSELLVLADDSADPSLVAADLLAQAEHDTDARPILITTSDRLADKVEVQLQQQLARLSDSAAARAALTNGFVVVCPALDDAASICDKLAPEHVQVMTRDAQAVATRLRHYGAIFIGSAAGEVLGDYGAGPNHVLPTGGSARHTAGLSVLTFLRARTWMRIDDPTAAAALASDAAALARLEGLEAHSRAAQRRLCQQPTSSTAPRPSSAPQPSMCSPT